MSKHQPSAQGPSAAKKSRKRISPTRRASAPSHRIRRSQRGRIELHRRPDRGGSVVVPSVSSRRPLKVASKTSGQSTPVSSDTTLAEKVYMLALLVFVVPIWLPLCWFAAEPAE